MAATNIFYHIPSHRGTRVASIPGIKCTLEEFYKHIALTEGLHPDTFIIASGTKVYRPRSQDLRAIFLQNNSHLDILIPTLGGKGGFGSLLRAIGAQIEKTTNRDACRDLSGRRLRDIKREDELKKLIALREKLEEEQKRRKAEKLEKLKKKTENCVASTPIQELVAMFDDHDYNKRRLEMTDILDCAIEKGIINFRKRKSDHDSKDSIEKKVRLQETKDEPKDHDQLRDNSEGEIPSKSLYEDKKRGTDSENESEGDEPCEQNNLWLGLEGDI